MLRRTSPALCLVAAVSSVACGGSSSETPLPLKPDLTVTRAPAPVASGGTSERSAAGAASGRGSDESAPSTWGPGDNASPSSKRFP